MTKFPLSWPDSWPRSARREASNFFGNSTKYRTPFNEPARQVAYKERRRHTMEESTRLVLGELGSMGVQQGDCIISTNVKVRLDGLPYSNQANPSDPGVAVYFKRKGKTIVLACDRWDRVEDNLWAVGKHIEALRGQERWGVGSLDQAFRGYAALPEKTEGEKWHEVFGCAAHESTDAVSAIWRRKVQETHPDKPGGSRHAFERVMQAWNEFKKERALP